MFDPFEKRLSRDLRNQLCNLFLQALEAGQNGGKADGQTDLFLSRANALRQYSLQQKDLDAAHMKFLEHRLSRYKEVFSVLNLGEPSPSPSDSVTIAFQLWSRDLFFECHEWLEGIWRNARGNRKKAIQALIRSVGAAVLWEAGRIRPAHSSALKAMDLLREFDAYLPPPFTREQMVPGLKNILAARPEEDPEKE